jgi:hypothetical protein
MYDLLRGPRPWKRILKGLRIRVNTIVTRTNYDSLANLASFVQEHGADKLTLIPVDDPGCSQHSNKSGQARLFNPCAG